MGADGSMVTIPTSHRGLKIRSDDIVIGSGATVNVAGGLPGSEITGFVVVREYLCCSAEI